MKLVLTEYYSDEEYCGVNTYPFTYESLEKAEYDFLQLYEDSKKSYDEYNTWFKDNQPTILNDDFNGFRVKYDEYVKTHNISPYFTFLTKEFSCDISLENISFLTLENWFTNNEI
jgi:hypothetical protein